MTTYRLIARDRVFCEGTLIECQKTLTGISQMIHAGLSTNFSVEEFTIILADSLIESLTEHSK